VCQGTGRVRNRIIGLVPIYEQRREAQSGTLANFVERSSCRRTRQSSVLLVLRTVPDGRGKAKAILKKARKGADG